MARCFTLAILLAAGHSVNAQQPAVPVEIGSPGIAPLQFATYVPPVYPQIARAARVTGEVVLDATIGTDGTTGDIRVVRSVPLLDQSAIDAVRGWRFVSPRVGGLTAPLRVPITFSFVQGGSFSVRVSPVRSPTLPADFAVVFSSRCPDGSTVRFNTATGVFERNRGIVSIRADLWADPSLLEASHAIMARSRFMSESGRLAQWPDMPGAQISASGIRVVVPLVPYFTDWSHGRPPQQYLLEVRMNGTWTRLFPPMTWPNLYPDEPLDERDADLDQGARQIGALLERHVQSIEAIRKLPRNQRWCRWPE